MKPTIKTIAKIAGVSHVTVSRALRGYSDISQATTQRIKQIAQEVGYTPNANARSLSSKRSRNIGMIVPSIGENVAYGPFFNAVSIAAAAYGQSVLLGSCERSIDLEKTYCRMMCENRVGALLVAPVSSDVAHIKEICRGTVPIIFIGGKNSFEEEFCIKHNYRHSAKLAVEHLYSLGHRDIALFLYNPLNLTIQQKLDGYTATIRALGLTPRVYWEGTSDETLEAGYRLIKKLIQQKNMPTAIWCASDLMAMGVLEALQEQGLSVPEDVSVVGHDNLQFSRFHSISLTTLDMPREEISQYAIKLALSIMEEIPAIVEPHAMFNPKLVVRGSTGPVSKRPL